MLLRLDIVVARKLHSFLVYFDPTDEERDLKRGYPFINNFPQLRKYAIRNTNALCKKNRIPLPDVSDWEFTVVQGPTTQSNDEKEKPQTVWLFRPRKNQDAKKRTSFCSWWSSFMNNNTDPIEKHQRKQKHSTKHANPFDTWDNDTMDTPISTVVDLKPSHSRKSKVKPLIKSNPDTGKIQENEAKTDGNISAASGDSGSGSGSNSPVAIETPGKLPELNPESRISQTPDVAQ